MSAVKKISKICCNTGCQIEGSPLGVVVIPGSGKLTEFPVTNNNLNCADEGKNVLDCVKNTNICPKAFSPSNVCLHECAEFAAASKLNFINGDLVIADPEPPMLAPGGILQHLPLAPTNELSNILPNLLGINGSLYIVGTHYKKISGFDSLRFVTGKIVIANNLELSEIPDFPCLLNVGGELIFIPPISDVPAEELCGQGSIIIANNNILRKISGFEALRQVSDGIFIADNPCLTHICGFIHLYRTNRIVIKGNPKLGKVVGFCYVDSINIGLYIFDNNLDGETDLVINSFGMLETAGTIVLIANNGLKSYRLGSLRTVGSQLVIRSNCQLEELFSSVNFVNELYIENNKSLVCISLPCLTEVNLGMNINANCGLLCLDTFDELRRVGSGIMIADNKQLTELKGFSKLKYIGSNCSHRPLIQLPSQCITCTCIVDIIFDWDSIVVIVLPDGTCSIIFDFPPNTFDPASLACAYELPDDFYRLLCHPSTPCGELAIIEEIPEAVSYSLIIYRNQRLRTISGFSSLKHLNSNLYIIHNVGLHTINSFHQLIFGLDVWIRNNPQLKHVIGFSNLLSIRDFILLESHCLCEINSLKCLDFAQSILIEAKTASALKNQRTLIPSVSGYLLYYCFV